MIVLFIIFVFLEVLFIVATVWSAKITHRDNKTKSTVIYGVYKELKRYNDSQEHDEVNLDLL